MSARDDYPLRRHGEVPPLGAIIEVERYAKAMAEIDRLRAEYEAFRKAQRQGRLQIPVHVRPRHPVTLSYTSTLLDDDLNALQIVITITTDGLLTVHDPTT